MVQPLLGAVGQVISVAQVPLCTWGFATPCGATFPGWLFAIARQIARRAGRAYQVLRALVRAFLTSRTSRLIASRRARTVSSKVLPVA